MKCLIISHDIKMIKYLIRPLSKEYRTLSRLIYRILIENINNGIDDFYIFNNNLIIYEIVNAYLLLNNKHFNLKTIDKKYTQTHNFEYILKDTNIILAIWNGDKSTITAKIIKEAELLNKKIYIIDPDNFDVVVIDTKGKLHFINDLKFNEQL